jgi:hypothetical protein
MAECGNLRRFNDSTQIRVRSGGMVDRCVAPYSTGNEPYRCRTPAVELETGERLIRLVDLSPPASIVEYPTFGNEGTMGLGGRLPFESRVASERHSFATPEVWYPICQIYHRQFFHGALPDAQSSSK